MDCRIRLGMIGAGKHATAQVYPCFARLEGADVVANCDLDLVRARAVGGRHGIARSYGNWKEMVAAENLNGVIVCISDRAHAELAPQIMEAGCHVLVENEPRDGHHPSFCASNDGSRLTGFQGGQEAFVAACASGVRPEADITNIHHTVAIHEAIRRAIDSGRSEEVRS